MPHDPFHDSVIRFVIFASLFRICYNGSRRSRKNAFVTVSKRTNAKEPQLRREAQHRRLAGGPQAKDVRQREVGNSG